MIVQPSRRAAVGRGELIPGANVRHRTRNYAMFQNASRAQLERTNLQARCMSASSYDVECRCDRHDQIASSPAIGARYRCWLRSILHNRISIQLVAKRSWQNLILPRRTGSRFWHSQDPNQTF